MTLQIRSLEQYHEAYRKSVEDPEGFWAEQASTFVWRKKWDSVLKNDFVTPDVQWFIGGKLNITENCLDRHLEKRANQTAIIWEPNNPCDGATGVQNYKQAYFWYLYNWNFNNRTDWNINDKWKVLAATRAIVTVSGPRQPPVYFLLNNGKELKQRQVAPDHERAHVWGHEICDLQGP